ncbi:uncharacterized protein LOC116678316 [Etheostoma spectabile]|uniref:uncharacterized protein LOC116678316 n=1 Tax=Etheostoma spectabile TaxID=54343 RepID=UPI0013AFD859|nr:uncharacterized protein LOC116678316 [Etheostoma spectabile]
MVQQTRPNQTRTLGLTATLLSQPHLTIKRCNTVNPATLVPTEEDGDPHHCQARVDEDYKPGPDLQDQPLSTGTTVFVDGSSSHGPDGKNYTGFAVVDQSKTLKSGKLAGNQSAQAAEIVALTEACKLFKGQDVTIYTDSQYAYATTHTFAKLWARRGMKTSTGKPVQHAALLTELLSAVMLPRTLAICKCKAHTNGPDLISQGNAKADAAAKAAAGNTVFQTYVANEPPKDIIFHDVLKDMQNSSPPSETSRWLLEGAQPDDNGLYRVAGQLCLPRALFPAVAKLSHGRSHISNRRGGIHSGGNTWSNYLF